MSDKIVLEVFTDENGDVKLREAGTNRIVSHVESIDIKSRVVTPTTKEVVIDVSLVKRVPIK